MNNHSNNPSNLIISNNIPEIDNIKVNKDLNNDKDNLNTKPNNDKVNLNTKKGTTIIISNNIPEIDNIKFNKDLNNDKVKNIISPVNEHKIDTTKVNKITKRLSQAYITTRLRRSQLIKLYIK